MTRDHTSRRRPFQPRPWEPLSESDYMGIGRHEEETARDLQWAMDAFASRRPPYDWWRIVSGCIAAVLVVLILIAIGLVLYRLVEVLG